MSIRKKLILSNIVMIAIPVLFAFLVFGAVNNIFDRRTRELRGRDQVGEILHTLSESGLDAAVAYCKELSQSDYSILMINKDGVLFQSDDYAEQNSILIEEYGGFDRINQFIMARPEGSEMFYTRSLGDDLIQLHVFQNSPMRPFAPNEETMRENVKTMQSLTLLAILATVVVTLCTSFILTALISRSVLTPLKILRNAANRIRMGDLDSKIEYNRNNEFGEVCDDFESMRIILKRNIEEREKYDESRKELLAGISHDLGTPLTLIKGYVAGILDGVAKTEEKQTEYLKTIGATADNMKKMVDNLFLFSKLDLNNIPFYFKSVNLVSFFEDCVRDLEPNMRKYQMNIYLETDLKELFVPLDVEQFRRVVLNITNNSCKYKKDGAGHILIRLCEEGNEAVISFIDDGVGVQKKNIHYIFDIFYREDKARTNTEKGSGLGLAIVKQIVAFHKGEVFARSEPGQGLEITVKLPKSKEISS